MALKMKYLQLVALPQANKLPAEPEPYLTQTQSGCVSIEKPHLWAGIYIFLRVICLINLTDGVGQGRAPRKLPLRTPPQERSPGGWLVGSSRCSLLQAQLSFGAEFLLFSRWPSPCPSDMATPDAMVSLDLGCFIKVALSTLEGLDLTDSFQTHLAAYFRLPLCKSTPELPR